MGEIHIIVYEWWVHLATQSGVELWQFYVIVNIKWDDGVQLWLMFGYHL